MSNLYKKLGIIIKSQRKYKNCSTQELAKYLNVSVGLINNIENAKNDVFKIDLLDRLIHYLDIPLVDLLSKNSFIKGQPLLDQTNSIIKIQLKTAPYTNTDLIESSLKNIISLYLEIIRDFGYEESAINIISAQIIQQFNTIYKLKRIE